jgi:uncharacterized protein HemX
METSFVDYPSPPEINMQTQPSSITQANPPAQIQRFHPSKSKAEKANHTGKAAIALAFSGIAILAIGIASWGKLRAEFAETFHQFASCPSCR